MMKFLEKCNGCRSCELACSFYHQLAFQPSKSSIEVIPVDVSYGGEGYKVNISTKNTGERFSCDKCEERAEPACVEYCHVDVRDNLRKLLYSSWNRVDK